MRKGQKSGLHGGRYTRAYKSWICMKSRCLNPKNNAYPRYGGRGITIFQPWVKSFSEFFNHIGEPPSSTYTIDRIDNSLGYQPGNIRWATKTQQALNTRRALVVSHQGKALPLKIWARELGIPYMTLFFRLKKGKSPEEILSPKKEK